MTSIPASRRARAMIFAPRSWPSNPALAMTTRIFRAGLIRGVDEGGLPPSCDDHSDLPGHVGKYMEVKLTVIGSSPAWPNPGSAQSGYLVEGPGKLLLDCGPGVLGKLRETKVIPDAIAITHWHLDHCGDLIPWAWLNAYSPEAGGARPELWLPPGALKEL